MTHHILTDVHGDKLVAVVNGEREADKIGCDGRSPRPGPYDLLVTYPIDLFDFRSQLFVYERSLLDRSWLYLRLLATDYF